MTDEAFDRIDDALRWGEERLRSRGIEAPRLQASLLLGDVLGWTRAQVLANLRQPLRDDPLDDYRALVERRADHEPLQYLRGRAPFLDFDVEVEPGVFIPRPETELVVETALELWDPAAGPLAFDVGTGSGVIAIALARARPEGRVVAVDRSPEALAVVARNVARLGLADRIRLVRSDLLAAFLPVDPGDAPRPGDGATEPGSPDTTPGSLAESIGLLISNPPYAADDAVVQPEVRDHEPRDAWAAGPTGLELYRRLVPQAAELLPPGRPMVLELGWGQDREVTTILEEDGRWETPHVGADFQGIPRVLAARRR